MHGFQNIFTANNWNTFVELTKQKTVNSNTEEKQSGDREAGVQVPGKEGSPMLKISLHISQAIRMEGTGVAKGSRQIFLGKMETSLLPGKTCLIEKSISCDLLQACKKVMEDLD